MILRNRLNYGFGDMLECYVKIEFDAMILSGNYMIQMNYFPYDIGIFVQ